MHVRITRALFALVAALLFLPIGLQAQTPGTAQSVNQVAQAANADGGPAFGRFSTLRQSHALGRRCRHRGTHGHDRCREACWRDRTQSVSLYRQCPRRRPRIERCRLAQGVPVAYEEVVTGMLFAPTSVGRADVTSIVASTLNAAPSGLVSLDYSELNTGATDGSVLAVVFQDPAAQTNTVLLLFGVQAPEGDNFSVALGAPFDDDETDIQSRSASRSAFNKAGRARTASLRSMATG